MEMKTSIATLENIWQFLKEQNIHLPYNPVITFLGDYPRELKTYVYRKTST
jgi:hypothetical protein